MSAARATFIPAPAAAPFTAAIAGCGIVRIFKTICMPARSKGSSSLVAPVSRPLPSSARSPPAQKARPAPVITTTRTSGSIAIRPSASSIATPSSLLSAFIRSGRFITRVAMPSCFPSRRTGVDGAACGVWLMIIPASVILRDPLFFDARDQLRKLSKMPEFFAPALGVRPAGGGQDVNSGAIERFFLYAVFALALGELFVRELPIEGHDVRCKFLELLRKHDAALGEIFTLELFDALRWAFYEIGESNTEFNDPLVIVVIEGLRDHTACIEHRPKLIRAAGVV